MKKTLTVILLSFVLQVNAQSEDEVKFGPRLGFNLAKFTEVDDSEFKGGLVAGGYMVYSFTERFGVSLDLLYSMEGSKFKTVTEVLGTTVTSENTSKLSYLRVPLLLNVFGGQLGDAFRPKIMLGPDLGFLLGSTYETESKVESGGTTTTTSTSSDSKEGINTVDFGAVIGLGLNVRLADRLWLDTDLRYYMGASEVFENSVGNDEPKNQHLQLSLGLGIGLGR